MILRRKILGVKEERDMNIDRYGYYDGTRDWVAIWGLDESLLGVKVEGFMRKFIRMPIWLDGSIWGGIMDWVSDSVIVYRIMGRRDRAEISGI